jgi:AP-2 complex subunit alpha
VLEEMPAFPERESSILAVLKKKKPGRVPENEIREGKSPAPTTNHQTDQPTAQVMHHK